MLSVSPLKIQFKVAQLDRDITQNVLNVRSLCMVLPFISGILERLKLNEQASKFFQFEILHCNEIVAYVALF